MVIVIESLGEQIPSHLRSVLRKTEDGLLGVDEALRRLRESYPEDGWDSDLLRIAVLWCKDRHRNPRKGKTDWDIRFLQGGRRLKFVKSSGRTPTGAGVVGQLVAKLNGRPLLKRSREVFGVKAGRICAYETSHGTASGGRWSIPDIVVEFYRGPRSKTPFEIHAIEVEERSRPGAIKTKPQEVAQAFVSGRGADRVWLLFHANDLDQLSEFEKERIEWTARQLGVGLISFLRAGEIRTWKRRTKARPKRFERRYRQELVSVVNASRAKAGTD
jgi:hypothetical protein